MVADVLKRVTGAVRSRVLPLSERPDDFARMSEAERLGAVFSGEYNSAIKPKLTAKDPLAYGLQFRHPITLQSEFNNDGRDQYFYLGTLPKADENALKAAVDLSFHEALYERMQSQLGLPVQDRHDFQAMVADAIEDIPFRVHEYLAGKSVALSGGFSVNDTYSFTADELAAFVDEAPVQRHAGMALYIGKLSNIVEYDMDRFSGITSEDVTPKTLQILRNAFAADIDVLENSRADGAQLDAKI